MEKYMERGGTLIHFFTKASATAFYKAIPVVEFLSEVIGKTVQQLAHPRSTLSEEERLKFAKEIKGKINLHDTIFPYNVILAYRIVCMWHNSCSTPPHLTPPPPTSPHPPPPPPP